MDTETIIRMAHEAGYQTVYLADAPIGRSYQFLERFAALVAAHEKKFWMEQIEVECNEAVLAEREACAKLCLETGIKHPQQSGQEACAIAIRTRSENAGT